MIKKEKKGLHKSQLVIYGAFILTMIIIVVVLGSMRGAQRKYIGNLYGQLLSPYGYIRNDYGSSSNTYCYRLYTTDSEYSSIEIRVNHGIFGVGDYIVREYSFRLRNHYDESIYDIIGSLPKAYDIRDCKNDIDNAIEDFTLIDKWLTIESPRNVSISVNSDSRVRGDEVVYEYTLYITFRYGEYY